jgi:transcriptional regulator with XRE-family HTH domain
MKKVLRPADKDISQSEFGERLRIARQAARLSQADLGKAIGVSDRAISSYEKGRTVPPIDNLKRIAEQTNYPLRFFVGEPDRMDLIQQLLTNVEKELKEVRDILAEKK